MLELSKMPLSLSFGDGNLVGFSGSDREIPTGLLVLVCCSESGQVQLLIMDLEVQ